MTTPRAGAVWWQSPVTVLVLVVPAAVVPAWFLGDEEFLLLWRTPRSLTPDILLMLLAGGLTVALAAAAVLAAAPRRPPGPRWPDLDDRQAALLSRWNSALLGLTVLGYVAYVRSALGAGVTLADVTAVFGSGGLYTGTLKDAVPPVAGVTTLTQFGIATGVLSAVLLLRTGSRRYVVAMAAVVLLAVPRALLLTERLAILEVVVPIVVVLTAGVAGSRRGGRLVAVVPLAAVPVVAALFASFEYSRSWVWFREHTDWTFLEFSVLRLAGYYVTALNNGALQILHNDHPARWPYETVSGLWTAPGIEQSQMYPRLSGRSQEERYLEILQTHGWEEFNNSSGLAAPFVDYGVVGGLVFMAVVGVVLGLLHRSFRDGRPSGVLLYPVLFLGIIELPRLLAWPAGRLLPSLAVLVVLALVARRGRAQRARLCAVPAAGGRPAPPPPPVPVPGPRAAPVPRVPVPPAPHRPRPPVVAADDVEHRGGSAPPP
jgi:hypothetical protein